MAITLAGTPQKVTGGGGFPTTLSLNLPLGGTTLTADTIVFINTGNRAGTPGTQTPAGWTLLATSSIDSADEAQVFYKTFASGSSMPSSVTLTANDGTGAGRWTALSIAYQGYNSSSPFDGTAVATPVASGSTTTTSPSYTTSLANSLVLWAYYFIGDESTPVPTYTQGTEEINADRNFTSANDFSSFVDETFVSAGGTGANTMTTSNGSAFGSSVITLALAVASAGGGGAAPFVEVNTVFFERR